MQQLSPITSMQMRVLLEIALGNPGYTSKSVIDIKALCAQGFIEKNDGAISITALGKDYFIPNEIAMRRQMLDPAFYRMTIPLQECEIVDKGLHVHIEYTNHCLQYAQYTHTQNDSLLESLGLYENYLLERLKCIGESKTPNLYLFEATKTVHLTPTEIAILSDHHRRQSVIRQNRVLELDTIIGNSATVVAFKNDTVTLQDTMRRHADELTAWAEKYTLVKHAVINLLDHNDAWDNHFNDSLLLAETIGENNPGHRYARQAEKTAEERNGESLQYTAAARKAEEQICALTGSAEKSKEENHTWCAHMMDEMKARGIIGVLWQYRPESSSEMADEIQALARPDNDFPLFKEPEWL